MKNYQIRLLNKTETPILEEFIYHAIFQRPGEPLLPRSIINEPTIAVFIKDFGKPDDNCLVAEIDIVNITLHFFLKDVRPTLPHVTKHSIAVA